MTDSQVLLEQALRPTRAPSVAAAERLRAARAAQTKAADEHPAVGRGELLTPELKEKMIAVNKKWAEIDAAKELKNATLNATDKEATLTVDEELKSVYEPAGVSFTTASASEDNDDAEEYNRSARAAAERTVASASVEAQPAPQPAAPAVGACIGAGSASPLSPPSAVSFTSERSGGHGNGEGHLCGLDEWAVERDAAAQARLGVGNLNARRPHDPGRAGAYNLRLEQQGCSGGVSEFCPRFVHGGV